MNLVYSVFLKIKKSLRGCYTSFIQQTMESCYECGNLTNNHVVCNARYAHCSYDRPTCTDCFCPSPIFMMPGPLGDSVSFYNTINGEVYFESCDKCKNKGLCYEMSDGLLCEHCIPRRSSRVTRRPSRYNPRV